ncbi:MAG: flagellar basal body-associated FliL family protein [Hyphomonas sp.]|jgi:flagellar basal body-associated protein FliL|nr:flagellar basal body-associated FliL family protein [Hyphomonas sp.]MDP3459135.1 flagellar basal body-associated FliL family protein [Hyphomonas sp.]
MKNIITAIIAIACIVAGGVGGHFLRSMSGGAPSPDKHAAEKADDGHGEKKDDHGAKPDKKDDHGAKAGKKDAHGKEAAGGATSGGVVYYKFTREFVVPIIRNGRVQSLVILNLNIEADESISQKLFEMEPKLRDNIMTTLITLSNDGKTFESMTTVENYESIRSMVLMNLKTVVSTGINNVLIVDFAKQEV